MYEVSHIAEQVSGVIALLLIGAIILWISKRFRLPFSVILVVSGMGLSWLSNLYPHVIGGLRSENLPDLIFYVFLPALVFESAINLDARQLKRNITEVLTLAIPGILLSTFIIGIIVSITTSIPFTYALLLGAILSATDPVAVIALFKQLGAPQRLTVLVEGESLFNDATAIVLSRLLLKIIIAGTLSANLVIFSVVDFIVLFLGGLALGIGLGLITSYILGLVESDSFIEITLTTTLAYFSFLLAEEIFHVSGIMATIGAGLILGGWGRMKISASVRSYLIHFWEYITFIANALIFLMVGMRIELSAMGQAWEMLLWVLLAMMISRAIIVYGLLPQICKVFGSERIKRSYQTIIYWGGLRGAIALAIVLSLPEFEYSETFVALVTGAVLFTLLIQGMSIESLMRKLGLDQPPLTDKLATAEVEMTAQQRTLEGISLLQAGGLFSGTIAAQLRSNCRKKIANINNAIGELRKSELNKEEERKLLYIRGFAEEKTLYIKMFNNGHLSERSFRELISELSIQIDHLRYQRNYNLADHDRSGFKYIKPKVINFLEKVKLLLPLVEQLRIQRVAMDYEEAWGHYQGSTHILKRLDMLAELESIPAEVVSEIRQQYQLWQDAARKKLDQVAEQFPEFVRIMQQRLGKRLTLLAETEAAEEQAEKGTLPRGQAENLMHAAAHKLSKLRGYEVARLKVEPEELLRKVPLFENIPRFEFSIMAKHLQAHTVADGEVIIRQDTPGDSLFLIARGVVRVSHKTNGISKDIATLIAGDFFGEMALLNNEQRTATVRAVTPCSLYELRRKDLKEIMHTYPVIRESLENASRKRKGELQQYIQNSD